MYMEILVTIYTFNYLRETVQEQLRGHMRANSCTGDLAFDNADTHTW